MEVNVSLKSEVATMEHYLALINMYRAPWVKFNAPPIPHLHKPEHLRPVNPVKLGRLQNVERHLARQEQRHQCGLSGRW